MAMSLEKFLEIAAPEQKEILFQLFDKIEEDNEIIRKIDRIYSYIEGGTFSEIIGTKEEFKARRANIAKLLKNAVEEYGMGDIEIIKKHYKKYVK
jgi:hypothetical protein